MVIGKTKWHEGLTCAQNQAEEPEQDEFASLREIAQEQGWKTCPGCKNMVERNRGCNHMTCRCRTEFCYKCGRVYEGGQATCSCELMDVDALDSEDEDYLHFLYEGSSDELSDESSAGL